MQELLTVQKLLHWRMEKLNAEAHIDEIIKTSEDKNKGRPNTPDENNLHGDMAKDGWRYREDYFMDYDGKYYVLTLSVAYGNNGKVAYNIANMRERSFPTLLGSSNPKTGAQRGKASLRDTIPQGSEESNTKEENAYVYAYGQRRQGYDGVIRTGILACGRAMSRL